MTTYTTSLRFTQPQVGADTNAWGTYLNTDMTLIEAAITGAVTVTLSGATATLTNVNGGTDQSRNQIIAFGGSPGATCVVTMPAVAKLGLFSNSTADASSVTLTTGSGTTQSLPSNGEFYWVYCDGTNVYALPLAVSTLRTTTLTVSGTLTSAYQEITSSLVGTAAETVHAPSTGIFSAFVVGALQVGSIANSGSGTVYNTTSDYRLKVVLGNFDAGAALDAVPVHLGHYKRDPGVSRAMFLAHEVQAAVPWAVTGTKDAIRTDGGIDPQMLDHSALVPVLWAELRALRARVAAAELRAIRTDRAMRDGVTRE